MNYVTHELQSRPLFIVPVMSKFAQRVDVAVETLSSNSPKDVDENDFIDASRLVYDGVREIRRAVLMNRVCNLACILYIYCQKKHVYVCNNYYSQCVNIRMQKNSIQKILS